MAINFTKIWDGVQVKPRASTAASEKGDIEVIDSTGALQYHDGTSVKKVVLETFSGNVDITGQLEVDNVLVNGNTISSTDTNGNIVLDPNGSGNVVVDSLSTSLPVKTGASKELTSGAINLASAEVTGVLPVANGGTGSATQNFVDLTTAQTVAGPKTLTSPILNTPTANTITGIAGGAFTVQSASGQNLSLQAQGAGVVSLESLTVDGTTISSPSDTDITITATGTGKVVVDAIEVTGSTVQAASNTNVNINAQGSGVVRLQKDGVTTAIVDADGIKVQSAKDLQLNNSGNTFYTALKAGANAANYTITLPAAAPEDNKVLKHVSGGVYEWGAGGGGGGGGGLSWSVITGTSQTIAVNNGYIANNASMITFTLPATAAVGDSFAIAGKGAGGWKIAQNASQYIIRDTLTTATGVNGFLISSHPKSCVELVCTVANTEFEVRNSQGATQSQAIAGFVFGGRTVDSPATGTNLIRKLTYSNDTITNLSNTLSNARLNLHTGGAASSDKAFVFGGTTSVYLDTISKLTIATEAVADIAATLSSQRFSTATSQNATNAYVTGGLVTPGSSVSSAIQKFTFSDETIATLGISLSTAREGSTGFWSTSKGYSLGGFTTAVGVLDITSITFATDTKTELGAVLAQIRYTSVGLSNPLGGFSYICGGNNNGSPTSGGVSTIIQFNHSTEARTTLGATLSSARSACAGTSGVDHGYITGGYNTAGVYTTVNDKFVWATETRTTTAATLSGGTAYSAGASPQ